MNCPHDTRERISPSWHLCHGCNRPVVTLVDVLVATGMHATRGAAKRDIKQGAVRLNGERVTHVEHAWAPLPGLEYVTNV